MTQCSVEIQQTADHHALGVPREHLEAVAAEVAETGVAEWGVGDPAPRWVVLRHQWGTRPVNILVRRLDAARFHVGFMTPGEMKRILDRLG